MLERLKLWFEEWGLIQQNFHSWSLSKFFPKNKHAGEKKIYKIQEYFRPQRHRGQLHEFKENSITMLKLLNYKRVLVSPSFNPDISTTFGMLQLNMNLKWWLPPIKSLMRKIANNKKIPISFRAARYFAFKRTFHLASLSSESFLGRWFPYLNFYYWRLLSFWMKVFYFMNLFAYYVKLFLQYFIF